MRLLTGILCLGLVGADCLAVEGDGRVREQQLAETLVSRLEDDATVWFEADGYQFLGLYQAALGALPRQAVLLVHNMGGHPDWPEVIAPLRRRLPDNGWSTLSLQMPLLASSALADDYGATMPEARRRIAAGVDYLRGQDYSRIVILGYGFGAVEALAYQSEYKAADGVITIGVLAREFLAPVIDLHSLLAGVEVPLLDIYGSNDLPEVTRKAESRRTAATGTGDGEFEQHMVEGADHYFTGQDTRLVEVVREWLNKNFTAESAATAGQRD